MFLFDVVSSSCDSFRNPLDRGGKDPNQTSDSDHFCVAYTVLSTMADFIPRCVVYFVVF